MPDFDVRAGCVDLLQHFVHEFRKIDGLHPDLRAAQPAVRQQVLNQRVHPGSGFADAMNVIYSDRIQAVLVILRKRLAETLHGAERSSQVVRNRERKGIQFAIDLLQIGCARFHALLQVEVQFADFSLHQLALGNVYVDFDDGRVPAVVMRGPSARDPDRCPILAAVLELA